MNRTRWLVIGLAGLLAILLVSLPVGPLWLTGLTNPVRSTITEAVRSVGGFGDWLGDVRKLSAERDSLAEERNTLLAQLVQMQAVERQNQALRQQLGVVPQLSQSLIMAKVSGMVNEGGSTYLLLGEGKKDGLTTGQIVISSGVLVGRIREVSDGASVVELPQSIGTVIPVMIHYDSGTTKGVVEGSFNLTAQLDQVLPTEKLTEGSVIVTSGEGGTYPPNIVVGKVGKIDNARGEVFQSAVVTLLLDATALETVFVVK